MSREVYLVKRIFELARELGVTSKMVLEKCRAEGLEVKNHMSAISVGLAATVCEWFSDAASQHTAVETSEHVDLETARAEAKKVRGRSRKKTKAENEDQAVAEAMKKAGAEEPAEAESPAVAEPVAVAPAAEAPAAEQAPAEGSAAETEAPPQAEQEELPEPKKPKKAEKPPAEEAPPKVKEEILPAGPQVVPAPAVLKGPHVVRFEEPEIEWRRPRPPRQRVVASMADVPLDALPKGGDGGKLAGDQLEHRGGKRRSPRRRGGRSADSGERAKEWRNADLRERSERLAAASGGGLRRHRASPSRKVSDMGSAVKTGPIAIEEPITVKGLSAATGIKSAMIIRKLMELGTMVTINQTIDTDVAEMVVADYEMELAVKKAETDEEQFLKVLDDRPKGDRLPRAPVVTFLGHVDHGKTSLLDGIRKTTVASAEAGGITQHTGAYRYDMGDKHVVFLDTPGHEAFTAMRARGANITDVVVLVVAADDGIMPQTIEAISHAKAAGVPIVVALNKIDLPNANIQRVLGQLAERDLQPREWGGDTEVIHTSAETGEGTDSLVETLSLEAELLELTAEVDAPASGYVIESEMDPGRGVVARLLVLEGTLSLGDMLLAGRGFGRVRQMTDGLGKSVQSVGPATPVAVSGLDEVPEAGDRFYVVADQDQARQVVEERRQIAREASLATGTQVTLENLFSKIEQGQVTEVNLILKADVHGSLEALTGSLEKLNTDEVRLDILHSGVGGISTGDVTLAEASAAIILGFNVVADAAARSLAEKRGIDIRLYRVIYDIIDDMRAVLEEGLAPEIREEPLGRAQVRQVFKVSRAGSIAGCFITEGVVMRNAMVRIIRDNVVLEDERTIESLKRFKDDAREVRSGMECGIKLRGYDDIKEGDELEFYRRVEVGRKL